MVGIANSKLSAQKITPQFNDSSFSAEAFAAMKKIVGHGKTIPVLYEKQILTALSYFPELINTNIIFRVKHAYTPLSTRPAWTSVLKSNDYRTYIITISDSSMPMLAPILLGKMDFNAQVGVLGHELSHVADFSRKNSFGLIRVGLGNLSQHFLDKFEYKTDSICIAHGLGYQLLSWSIFVRKTLHHENWDGADNVKEPMKRERYMNPSTIRSHMKQMDVYTGK